MLFDSAVGKTFQGISRIRKAVPSYYIPRGVLGHCLLWTSTPHILKSQGFPQAKEAGYSCSWVHGGPGAACAGRSPWQPCGGADCQHCSTRELRCSSGFHRDFKHKTNREGRRLPQRVPEQGYSSWNCGSRLQWGPQKAVAATLLLEKAADSAMKPKRVFTQPRTNNARQVRLCVQILPLGLGRYNLFSGFMEALSSRSSP